jgi:1,4-dihydroxy-2-naphthoate octaprenyltransferase
MSENIIERKKAIRAIKLLLFSASVIPSCVAASLAYYDGYFILPTFIILAFALFIGQMGGDYLYYYFTNLHSDARDSHTKIFAGWEPLFTQILPKERGTLYAGIVCLLIDLIIGIFFLLHLGWAVIPLALAGGLVAIFFTPLMLRGYKEPVIFVTFGPLAIVSVYFVMSHNFSLTPVLVSLPIAFFVTVVAHLTGAHYEVKEIEGQETVIKLDKVKIILLLILGYVSLIVAVVLHFMPAWTLLGLVSLPVALSVVTVLQKSSSKVEKYLWAVVRSILVLISSGLLISLGYIIAK